MSSSGASEWFWVRGRRGSEGMKRVVLIVDDEERVLFVLQNALKGLENGLEVVTAATAEEGLRKVRETPFDLVITDLIMPDVDGIELTERVRGLRADVPVVWMTAYGCASFQADAERLGVNWCLEKPLEIGEFREVACRALTAREQGANSAEAA